MFCLLILHDTFFLVVVQFSDFHKMLKTDQTDSSDSEMELDGDNSNTLDGSTLQDSTRKLRYMDLMNKMEEIRM